MSASGTSAPSPVHLAVALDALVADRTLACISLGGRFLIADSHNQRIRLVAGQALFKIYLLAPDNRSRHAARCSDVAVEVDHAHRPAGNLRCSGQTGILSRKPEGNSAFVSV